MCNVGVFNLLHLFRSEVLADPSRTRGKPIHEESGKDFLFPFSHQPIILGPIRRIDDYPCISDDIRFNRKDGELSSEKCTQGSLREVMPKIMFSWKYYLH